MKILPLIVTLIACLLAGCDKRKGELTRPLAAELLNEQLARPSFRELQFSDDGFDRAERDGIITKNDGTGRKRFTEKGLKIVSSVISDNFIYEDRSTHVNFALKAPIGERVREVTGISAAPYGTGVSSVEYITDYLIPTELRPMAQYIYTGRRATSVFRKYDDGWRIVKE